VGDPAVTSLIDPRGKLSDAQVEEKLRAEIERERSYGVQYWALFDQCKGGSSAAAGYGLGSIHQANRISRWDSTS
jgi:hypothetical protein